MAILAISLDLILDVVARLFNRTLRINEYIYIYFFFEKLYTGMRVSAYDVYMRVYTFILKYLLSEARSCGRSSRS